jgi:RHS repeat-associated protein
MHLTPLGVHQQAYTYYPSGDVETITHHWNGQPFSTLRYEYDDAGRLLRIFYSGHLLAEYSYDGAGRLRNQTVYPLSGGAPLQAHITYADNQSVSAIGTISWQFGNNLLAHFDYTGATASSVEPNDRYQGRGYYPDGTVRRIDEQLWDPGQNRYRTYHWWLDYGVEGALQRSRLDSDQAVTERTYTYDEGGNLRSRSEAETNAPWYYEDNQLYYVPAERWFFTYTARGERRLWYTEAQRLRSDVNRDGQVDDADLLAVQFAYGQQCNGCPADVTGDGVVDDADLLQVLYDFGTVAGSWSWRYQYDFWGNLVWAYSNTGWNYFAGYDALGRRIAEKVVENRQVRREFYFLYEGDTIIAEVDGATGQVVAEYVWGLLGPIARIDHQNPAGTRYYILDALGHTRALVAGNGQITDVYSYDEWGRLIGAGDPQQGLNLTRNLFTWNGAYGYEWVPETGLYHVGAREYDPRAARWLQRDPIDAASGDLNLYRYAGLAK